MPEQTYLQAVCWNKMCNVRATTVRMGTQPCTVRAAATCHCQRKMHKNTFMENLLPTTMKRTWVFMRSTDTFVRFYTTV